MKTQRINRPTAKARRSQLDPKFTVIEVSGAKGEGLLIDVHESGAGGLYVIPHNANAAVYLMVGDHRDGCGLFHATERQCDCGACLVWRNGHWTPTSKARANADALGAAVGPASA